MVVTVIADSVLEELATPYVNGEKGVLSPEEALQGARDILAEQISDGGRFDKYDKTNPPRCWLNQNRLSLHANQTAEPC